MFLYTTGTFRLLRFPFLMRSRFYVVFTGVHKETTSLVVSFFRFTTGDFSNQLIESFGLPFLKVHSHSVQRMSLELWTIKLRLDSGR